MYFYKYIFYIFFYLLCIYFFILYIVIGKILFQVFQTTFSHFKLSQKLSISNTFSYSIRWNTFDFKTVPLALLLFQILFQVFQVYKKNRELNSLFEYFLCICIYFCFCKCRQVITSCFLALIARLYLFYSFLI